MFIFVKQTNKQTNNHTYIDPFHFYHHPLFHSDHSKKLYTPKKKIPMSFGGLHEICAPSIEYGWCLWYLCTFREAKGWWNQVGCVLLWSATAATSLGLGWWFFLRNLRIPLGQQVDSENKKHTQLPGGLWVCFFWQTSFFWQEKLRLFSMMVDGHVDGSPLSVWLGGRNTQIIQHGFCSSGRFFQTPYPSHSRFLFGKLEAKLVVTDAWRGSGYEVVTISLFESTQRRLRSGYKINLWRPQSAIVYSIWCDKINLR